MSGWAAKKFWKEAKAVEADGGYTVHLDGRAVKTPAKSPFVVPTLAMARAIAAEWDAQGEQVDPLSMPCTRSANAAIDKVSHQFDEVADMIAEYGDADLLCYRAESPVELAARQAEAWDPLLDWAAETLNARLEPRVGILHAPQSPDAMSSLRARVHALTPFQLTGFHDLVGISGSLIIGFAATAGYAPADDLFNLSRIDEAWQIEQWGDDEEATEIAEKKRGEFAHAFRFFSLCT